MRDRRAEASAPDDDREGSGVHPMKAFDLPASSVPARRRPGTDPAWVVLLCVLALASLACGDYGGSSTNGSVVASSFGTGLPDGLSVAEQVTSFETTVYPVLRTNCASCHSGSGPGSPRIADPDSATAWSAVVDNQKVNFSDPAASRLVRRLASD